jgi:small subunit ribosomal protein S14
MAKVSAVEKNNKRRRLTSKDAEKRAELKAIIMNKNTSFPERLEAVNKLDKLNPNGSKIRIRNRCELTGRPRGYYRKFGVSRIILRDLASIGQLPGLTKSSW